MQTQPWSRRCILGPHAGHIHPIAARQPHVCSNAVCEANVVQATRPVAAACLVLQSIIMRIKDVDEIAFISLNFTHNLICL